jgi:hypothetical protein
MQKRLFRRRAHSVWIVVGTRWNGANIAFVLFLVEQVRKITFRKFVNTKDFGKISQSHWNFQRIDELDFEHRYR